MIRRAALLSSTALTPQSKGVVDCHILDSWDQIICNIKSGRASEFYQLGDFKEIDMGEWGMNIMVLDTFNPTDVFLDSAQTIYPSVKWVTRYLLGKKIIMPDDSKATSWADSNLKKIFNENIFNCLPEPFKSALVPTWKTVYRQYFANYPDQSYLRSHSPNTSGGPRYNWSRNLNGHFIHNAYTGHYPQSVPYLPPFESEDKILNTGTLCTFNKYYDEVTGFAGSMRNVASTGYTVAIGKGQSCCAYLECCM